MNNQISFRISHAFLGEGNKNKYGTYHEKGKNYLFAAFYGGFMFKNQPFLCFLVPDDNSALAGLIKLGATKDFFTTSAANLQFKPDFRQIKAGDSPIIYHGLLIKDNSQIWKITEAERLPFLITFKVISEKKTKSETVGLNDYNHELEIRPLDLEIEGLPKITRLVFEFADDPPSTTHPWTNLTKSKFYNSNILTETVGKTFTMGVKDWLIGSQDNRLNYNSLVFQNDWHFDWNSFRMVEDNKENNNNRSNNPTPENLNTLKTALISVGIIAGLILIILTFLYFWKRKSQSKK